MSLRKKMIVYGFESNDEYDYQINCCLESELSTIRCLNIVGNSQRRKTAFANALAQALEVKRILYHDFTEKKPPPVEIIVPEITDEQGCKEPELESFDKIMIEASAYSEAEDTVLILDQIQAADFRDHIRIFQYLENNVWTVRNGEYFANKRHLLVFLISEEPLYHSLQKRSFRVWVSNVSHNLIHYKPEDFDLPPQSDAMLSALENLFSVLGMVPTKTEYRHLLVDIKNRVYDMEGLRHSIFGWVEGVDRTKLFSEKMDAIVNMALMAIQDYQCLDQVELKAPD